MMSSASTSRANRSSKDKTAKGQQSTQNVKSEGPQKNQVRQWVKGVRGQFLSELKKPDINYLFV